MLIACLSWLSPAAQELSINHSAATYDSIITAWKQHNIYESFDDYIDSYISLDKEYVGALGVVSDSVYKARLSAMPSPIRLPYNNIIKERIIAYTNTYKSVTERMLGYSKYYFPMFEEELAKNGLPLELKFLAVVESALTPTAVSRAGAVGLWQMMLATGRHYGLEVSSMVDQRRDPLASTKAACAYLKELYNIYGDWTLALASYNYGPGNVNKALSRSTAENKTYWDIYPYLPRETRNYIPTLVALIYSYHYYNEHNIKPKTPPMPLAVDTVTINKNMHLGQVASTLDVPLELLQLLNPQYKLDIIPAASKPYSLVLPQQEIARFIDNEASIYAKDTIYMAEYLKVPGANINKALASNSGTVYKVKSGDTLGAIAKKHGTTVSQIKKINGLKNDVLKIGQSLNVN